MTAALKALTANDLRSGRVIFLARGGAEWTLRFAEAEVFADDSAAATALSRAQAATTAVADPYLIDLADQGGGFPAPLSLRERIRALGPTTEPDLGVQAEGGAVAEALQKAVGAARSSGRLGLIRRK
jgi:hypothetical protein